jgi:galactokinase
VEAAYAERRAACARAASALGVRALRDVSPGQVEAAAADLGDVGYRRARHVVGENARVLQAVDALRRGDVERLGRLLDASHRSLRDDYEVSSPELDTAVAAARAAGAAGARMTGAGFGGCGIALVPVGRVDAVEREVKAAFAEHGFPEPRQFTVTAAGGARRIA